MPTKESRGKTFLEGKSKADHIKTERERILKREMEAMKFRDALENIASRLKTLNRDSLSHEKSHKLPAFFCEDAKIWIGRKVWHATMLSVKRVMWRI